LYVILPDEPHKRIAFYPSKWHNARETAFEVYLTTFQSRETTMRFGFISALSLTLVSIGCKQQSALSASRSLETSPTPTQEALADLTTECGTLVFVKGEIYLQIVSGNSETNADRLLEPQDGATTNVLTAKAEKLESVCINADFSKPDPVMITSVSQILPPTK
jgi:hypothetical protein